MSDGPSPLQFVDLGAQLSVVESSVKAAFAKVFGHGQFIMGPEVFELEQRLAAYCGVGHAVTCSSGTDALVMALMAANVSGGDAVIVPSFTFAATAEAVALVGATPVFADVLDTTYNIDVESARSAIEVATQQGLRPKAIIAVDLFGQPSDYDAVSKLCNESGLFLIADAAQSFGGSWRGKNVGSLAELTATSFYPAKPLGCYGDGGAVLTDNDDLAESLRSIRVHGQGATRYENVAIGINGRLDTLQAAVLLCKLDIFDGELSKRRAVADSYANALSVADELALPVIDYRALSSWAAYSVRAKRRDELVEDLTSAGIPTAIYYPIPVHHQIAYRHFPRAATVLPVAETAARTILSLPFHAYLTNDDMQRVASEVVHALGRR